MSIFRFLDLVEFVCELHDIILYYPWAETREQMIHGEGSCTHALSGDLDGRIPLPCIATDCISLNSEW